MIRLEVLVSTVDEKGEFEQNLGAATLYVDLKNGSVEI